MHDLLPNESVESLALLEEIFDLEMELYLLDGAWTSCKSAQPLEPSHQDYLANRHDPYQTITIDAHRGNQLVAISTPVEEKQIVAIADFGLAYDSSNQARFQKFARVAEKLMAQSALSIQTSTLYEELSGLMEETTWLRNISQYVRMCDVSAKSDNIIQAILPRLHEMIKASSMGFISANHSGLKDSWVGQEASFPIHDLIEAHSAEAINRPVVVNNYEGGKERRFSRSYILVHVGSSDEHYGWLVALNRLDQLSLLENVRFSTTGVQEFGTNEAGLIQAAADLLSTHARNRNLYEAREELLLGVIQAMSDAVDARDPYTKGHSDRVASYAKAIAEEIGMDQEACEKIHLTGLLHDIGKIGIPDYVLNKQGKLTDDEYEIIKKHPKIGYNILSHLKDISFVLPGVLHHHERADGKGYPHGLTAENNTLEANILAVADAFDAMTSTRSYRPSMTLEKAKKIIEEEVGKQFDPLAAAAFIKAWPTIKKISESDTRRCQTHREAIELLQSESDDNSPVGINMSAIMHDA